MTDLDNPVDRQRVAVPIRQLRRGRQAAGLRQSSMANRWTQEELLDNLRTGRACRKTC
jgi:hypothetical protein